MEITGEGPLCPIATQLPLVVKDLAEQLELVGLLVSGYQPRDISA